jgi:hypothetical protein
MRIPTTLAIAIGLSIGAVSGYWYRGQIEIAREQAALHEFMTSPPHVLMMAPPSKEPLPWTPGWNPKAKK